MDDSRGRRRTAYVPTGWRITGRDADQIASRAAAAAASTLEPGNPDEALYALQCTLRPVAPGRPVVEHVLDAIGDEIRRTWPECPRLTRDEAVSREPSRFGGLRFDFLRERTSGWTGEIVWRAVHPVVAGAPVTTQVLLEERPSFTRLTVRVIADDGVQSVRGYVGAGQAQPAFLRALRDHLEFTWLGAPLRPQLLRPGEVRHFVPGVLEADRDHPVAVLAPLEEGGYLLDPDDLAWDLLGRAQLFVITEHRATFELTDTVGDKRMSCYWGAARCYFPEFSRHDDPRDHPLLVADRLEDPVIRATWLGEIGIWNAAGVVMPDGIEERRATPGSRTTRRPAEGTAKPDAATSVGAAAAQQPPPPPSAATEPDAATAQMVAGIAADLRSLTTAVRALADEVERLRTVSSVRSASTSAIERRLGRLEDLLEHAFAPAAADAADASADVARNVEPDADDDDRQTLRDVVQEAAEAHSDALLFLDSVWAAAAASPYEDPDRVRAVLDAMASVARRRRDGQLGTSLREAFSDLGIDYRAAIARGTSARLREQYRFQHPTLGTVEAEEHIALGGTYDPRRCLRIYFSSRVPAEPRFVIGHVGRHFQVKTTT